MKRITPSTGVDVQEPGRKLQNSKSPGTNGTPSEVVKEIIKIQPEVILNIINKLMEKGLFPAEWKKARLALV